VVTKNELIERFKADEAWWIKRGKERDKVHRHLNECIDSKDEMLKQVKESTKRNCIRIVNRLYKERSYGERKRFVEEIIKEIKGI
jgi:hypothetical protein